MTSPTAADKRERSVDISMTELGMDAQKSGNVVRKKFGVFEIGFRFEWPRWPKADARISDSFGYPQRLLQGLFVSRVRRYRAGVLCLPRR